MRRVYPDAIYCEIASLLFLTSLTSLHLQQDTDTFHYKTTAMSTEPSRWHRYPFWRAYIGRDFIDALPPWPHTLRNNDKGFYLQSKADIGSSSTTSVFFMYFRWQDAEGVNRVGRLWETQILVPVC